MRSPISQSPSFESPCLDGRLDFSLRQLQNDFSVDDSLTLMKAISTLGINYNAQYTARSYCLVEFYAGHTCGAKSNLHISSDGLVRKPLLVALCRFLVWMVCPLFMCLPCCHDAVPTFNSQSAKCRDPDAQARIHSLIETEIPGGHSQLDQILTQAWKTSAFKSRAQFVTMALLCWIALAIISFVAVCEHVPSCNSAVHPGAML